MAGLFDRRGRRGEESQLASAVAAVAEAREAVRIAQEQYQSFVDDDDEARVRALTSENSADWREADHAHRHAERMRAALEEARLRVQVAERLRDELLANYGEGERR